MVEPHACNRDVPLAHPWLDGQNAICGYLEKYIDPKCVGCYRVRNAPYREITKDQAKVQQSWNERWAR